ncbi:MAG: cob(I)yrinic acid a,c-diamide adenosyltransferase [Nitrosomonadaceae bacterium]
MANRLTRIYTRTGDDGTTGLGDGTRASKDSARIEAMGCVDELNSCLGLLLVEHVAESVRSQLENIQHDLFDLGGDLSIPGRISMSKEQIIRLEHQLDQYNASLPALKEFILPGGSKAAALCHLARTVCRRAERSLVKLVQTEEVASLNIQYLNRLSDFLFVLSRTLNRQKDVEDVLWQPCKSHSTGTEQ